MLGIQLVATLVLAAFVGLTPLPAKPLSMRLGYFSFHSPLLMGAFLLIL